MPRKPRMYLPGVPEIIGDRPLLNFDKHGLSPNNVDGFYISNTQNQRGQLPLYNPTPIKIPQTWFTDERS